MDYKAILEKCDDPGVGKAVSDAVGFLLAKNIGALRRDASERSIASHLARHLQPHFPNLDVDNDYNRMGDAPKRLNWNDNLDLVYPDIIVHSAGTDTNILVIELKKGSNPQAKSDDILKLRAFRREFLYQHALFIRLGVGDEAGSILECEWVVA